MKSPESRNRRASPDAQLSIECEWLARLEGGPWDSIGKRIADTLRHDDLADFLCILEQHNRESKIPFLLGSYVLQVLLRERARAENVKMMPTLDQPAADVKRDLIEVAEKSRELAKLFRRTLQPHFLQAGASEKYDAAALMGLLVVPSSSEEEALVSLSRLLDDAAPAIDAVSQRAPRATQNRRPAKMASEARAQELRLGASKYLVETFRQHLGQPYHAHVATIATIVSKIKTDADFVKKAERPRTGADGVR
jgi:hypothetical protein